MASVSICASCIKADVCSEKKSVVQQMEYLVNKQFSSISVKGGGLIEEAPLKRCYDLKNMGVYYQITCNSKVTKYDYEND